MPSSVVGATLFSLTNPVQRDALLFVIVKTYVSRIPIVKYTINQIYVTNKSQTFNIRHNKREDKIRIKNDNIYKRFKAKNKSSQIK